LMGIGIGMTWFAVDLLFSSNWKNLETVKLSAVNFLFWLIVSFLIGVFFYFAGWTFNNDSWSLLMTTVISFIIMYTIAYGTYFFHLWHEVNQINKKLKKNGE